MGEDVAIVRGDPHTAAQGEGNERGEQGRQGACEVTVATVNILSATPADQRGAGAGANVTGRMAELDDIFQRAGLEVVGVQEGRLSTSQTLTSDNYVIHAAAAIRGNYGVQLWIAKSVERRLRPEVHELSTNLMIAHGRLRQGGGKVPLAIVVAHGPHARAGQDVIDGFFSELDEALGELPENAHIIVLADFNATVGDDRSMPDRVGGADAEPLNPPGERLMECIGTHSLVALNTFEAQPPTFTRGGRRTRLDYILATGLSPRASRA